MAFPVYHSADTVLSDTVSLSPNIEQVDYPSNITAGDLLVLIGASDNSARYLGVAPAGYTVVYNSNTTSPAPAFLCVKIADGTETGTTTFETATTYAGRKYAYIHARFSGTTSNVGEIAVSSLNSAVPGNTVSTLDVTAANGAGDNLFMSVYHASNDGSSPTAPTTIFPDGTAFSLLNFYGVAAFALAESTSATYGAGDSWVHPNSAYNIGTYTIVIPPAASSGVSETITKRSFFLTDQAVDVAISSGLIETISKRSFSIDKYTVQIGISQDESVTPRQLELTSATLDMQQDLALSIEPRSMGMASSVILGGGTIEAVSPAEPQLTPADVFVEHPVNETIDKGIVRLTQYRPEVTAAGAVDKIDNRGMLQLKGSLG